MGTGENRSTEYESWAWSWSLSWSPSSPLSCIISRHSCVSWQLSSPKGLLRPAVCRHTVVFFLFPPSSLYCCVIAVVVWLQRSSSVLSSKTVPYEFPIIVLILLLSLVACCCSCSSCTCGVQCFYMAFDIVIVVVAVVAVVVVGRRKWDRNDRDETSPRGFVELYGCGVAFYDCIAYTTAITVKRGESEGAMSSLSSSSSNTI